MERRDLFRSSLLAAAATLAPALSLLLLDGLLSLCLLCGVRLVCRRLREHSRTSKPSNLDPVRRVAIIGTGTSATDLAEYFLRCPDASRRVIAFFDDPPHTWHWRPYNLPVMGPPECLLHAEWRSKIDEVIVALPEAPPARLHEIRALLQELPVRVTLASGWPLVESQKL